MEIASFLILRCEREARASKGAETLVLGTVFAAAVVAEYSLADRGRFERSATRGA